MRLPLRHVEYTKCVNLRICGAVIGYHKENFPGLLSATGNCSSASLTKGGRSLSIGSCAKTGIWSQIWIEFLAGAGAPLRDCAQYWFLLP